MKAKRENGKSAPADRRPRDSESDTRALLELAGELAAAATPTQVAHALVERLPPLFGAVGGALGLIRDEELVIVDPGGVRRATLPGELRLPLSTRAPITQAARTGEPVYTCSRAQFERDFPDGAKLAEYADGALAVPLIAGKRVVGAMGFPFETTDAIQSDLLALALLAAALGGQALERARLYDRERSLREGLDRIARLAPRFAGRSDDEVMSAICREGRRTFDAETAFLWRLDGSEIVGEHRDPADAHTGELRLPRGAISALETALEELSPVFSEAGANEPGEPGSPIPPGRATLQIPIVLGGAAGHVLTLVFEPDGASSRQETLVLARRLADHAQLALEHGAREHAQASAARSALETRRLLDATSALAAATTPELVGAAAIEEASTTLGAAAGVLVRLDGDELVVVATIGFSEADVEPWRRFPVTMDVPIAAALRRREIVILESRDQLVREYPQLASTARSGASLSIPLTAGGEPRGALGLTFAEPRSFGEGDLAYVASVARQAGLALDRTILFEEEHRARERAERLAMDLTRLHTFAVSLAAATSTSEVGTLLCEQVKELLGADACAVYVPNGGELMELLRASGPDASPDAEPYWPDALESALHPASSVWLEHDDDWGGHDRYESLRRKGSPTAVVPLAVAGRPTGTLVAWFPVGGYPQESARRLFETMVRQATQPLDRLRLLESERRARLDAQTAALRTRTLREVADRLSVAVTPEDVADVLVSVLQSPLAADAVEVFSIDEAEERADLLASSEPSDDRTIPLGTLALDVPAADREPTALEVGRTSISFSLPSGTRTPGAVRLTYDAPVVLDEESEAMIRAIARQGGPALDRSRLYEEEALARSRMELLQSLTTAFSAALTLDEVATAFITDTLRALAADGVYLGIVDPDARELRALGSRGYPDELVTEHLSLPLTDSSPLATAARTGAPLYYARIEELWAAHPDLASTLDELDLRRFAVLPVRAGARTLGVVLVSWGEPFRFDDDLRGFLEAFAAQCGLALDRAERYEAERSVAETLQRSFLPESIPVMEGAWVAARYLPGTSALDVGGDWYDTLTLADGRLGFVVGDVVGKGVRAASTMAQLRNGLRALTLDDTDIAGTMSKLNRLLEGITETPFATVAFLTLEPETVQACLVSAGHLPPLVVEPDGSTHYLELGRNLPLGVDAELVYAADTVSIAPGSFVVLYTDGLVERADESIDAGLDRLASVEVPAERNPEAFADAILVELLGDRPRRDDIALLVVQLTGASSRPFDLTLPAQRTSLNPLREALARWLADSHVPDAEAKDVLLAVWEAAANGIEHARPDDEGTIGVVAVIVGDRVRVEVSDTGSWKEAIARDDRGLGLRMMREVMTEVDILRTGDGTRVDMERSVSMRTAGDGADSAGNDPDR